MTTESGRKLNDTVLLGLSVGNSFFSEARTERLVAWAGENYTSVYAMISDFCSIHTWQALGKEYDTSRKTLRLRGNALRNKLERAVLATGVPVTLLRWEDEIIPHPVYRLTYARLAQSYALCSDFHQDALEHSKRVLEKHGVTPTKQQAEHASLFLLEELSLILSLPEIIGAQGVDYVYHQPWPILTRLVEGSYTTMKYQMVSSGVRFAQYFESNSSREATPYQE